MYRHQQSYSTFKIIDQGNFLPSLQQILCYGFSPLPRMVWPLGKRRRLRRGCGDSWKQKWSLHYFPCATLCAHYTLHAHVLVGMLTLWPEIFLGNAVLHFQRLSRQTARKDLNSFSLKFPTETELGIRRLTAGEGGNRATQRSRNVCAWARL